MAGDPTNVSIWYEADVLIYKPAVLDPLDLPTDITTPFDTTTAWDDPGAKWGFLGLISGDAGLDDARTWSEKDVDAWGYGAILVGSKDFKMETKVSYLEENPVTKAIEWPGATDTTLNVPRPAYYYTAFEKRTLSGTIHRRITKRPARHWVQRVRDVEGDVVPREISTRIFPDSGFVLFSTQNSS